MQYQRGKLPDANILWSPRVGFNWDVHGRPQHADPRRHRRLHRPARLRLDLEPDRQHRRAHRVRAGRQHRPRARSARTRTTTSRPTSPARRRRATSWPSPIRTSSSRRCGATTSPSTSACPGAGRGTAEFLYNRDVNGIYYINANLPAAQSAFAGADTRVPRCARSNRINNVAGNQVTSNAIVLKNQNVGRSWNIAFSAEQPMTHGFWVKTAYSYGEAKNTVDPGSIALGLLEQQPDRRTIRTTRRVGFSTSIAGHRFYLTALVHAGVLRASAARPSRPSGTGEHDRQRPATSSPATSTATAARATT